MPLAVGGIYYIWCSYLEPPKEKICICICGETPYFFWVNTDPRPHGIAQIPLRAGISNGIMHDSHADLSDLKRASERDLARARDHGIMSDEMRALIVSGLQQPIRTLAEHYRQLALNNLT